MKVIIVVFCLLIGSTVMANGSKKSEMLIKEARSFLKKGDLVMAKSLVNIILIEDRNNKKAKSLKKEIKKLSAKSNNKKKIDLSTNVNVLN